MMYGVSFELVVIEKEEGREALNRGGLKEFIRLWGEGRLLKNCGEDILPRPL